MNINDLPSNEDPKEFFASHFRKIQYLKKNQKKALLKKSEKSTNFPEHNFFFCGKSHWSTKYLLPIR